MTTQQCKAVNVENVYLSPPARAGAHDPTFGVSSGHPRMHPIECTNEWTRPRHPNGPFPRTRCHVCAVLGATVKFA